MKRIYFLSYLFVIFSSYLLVNYNEKIPSSYKIIVYLNLITHLIAFIYSFNFLYILKIPFITFFSFLSSITYGFSMLFLFDYDFQLGTLDYSILNKLFIGFLIFYLLYFILLTFKIKGINKINNIEYVSKISFKSILNISIILFLLNLFIKIPINGFKEFIQFTICGLFLIGFMNKLNPKGYNLILLLFVSSVFIELFLTGLIYSIIYFSLYLISIFFYFFSKKLYQYFIIVVFSIFILILSTLFSSVKFAYRELSSDKIKTQEKISIAYDLITDNENLNYESNINKVKDGPIWRLSYPLSAISQVSLMTPSIVPYWNGESYYNILYKFIPRFLWTNKPYENMGQVFGHRYFFLSDDNIYTSMNSPIISEAFMNFGYVGFYTLFVIMAIIFSNVFFKFNLKNHNNNSLYDYFNTIYCALSVLYFNQWESNFSMMVGKIILLYFFINVTNLFVFKKVV